MKFEIKNRWTGRAKFMAEIECAEDASIGLKIGLAVKWAIKNDADLSDADLSDADLRRADLSRADLSDADLRSADLRSADLRGADLSSAYLSSADLSDADLSCADLSDADLRGADLSRADLSDADLRSADLRSADLRSANLSGADLNSANLIGADLRSADLRSANLSGADLNSADLSRADLSDADLRSADLRGADLSSANLSSLKIPLIENLDAKILAAIEINKAAGTNGLDMGVWHGKNCDENNWCQTTHCRAGYAVCVAGKSGFDLERALGGNTALAAELLYRNSMPDEPLPDFYCSNEEAMADMRARAGKYTAAKGDAP